MLYIMKINTRTLNVFSFCPLHEKLSVDATLHLAHDSPYATAASLYSDLFILFSFFFYILTTKTNHGVP